MKTLYTRIAVTFILISFTSSLIALFASNLYYQKQLMEKSEHKLMGIGKEIRALFEQAPGLELDAYFSHIANMGFQIYAVNEQLEGIFYGGPFRNKELAPDLIQRILDGEVYNGISPERNFIVISFFENSLHNSVGLPLHVDGKRYALFIRPDLEKQFGEMRIYMAILLLLTFVCSAILTVILTRFIVKPIKDLTNATQQIVDGNFNIKFNVSRKDEIGNLAQHFTTMVRSIKQLDEMRQEFVANVSHEIQSPLTTIQGFAQTMLDQKAASEEAEHYLHIISEESKRLSSLSKQLLTLATLDKEDHVIKSRSFRLDEQIRQVLIATEWHWTKKQILIEIEIPEIIITADEQLLYQVWFNLITNSIKFSRVGGLVHIEIVVDQGITVTVSDSGIGIGESELPHIFDRFYKADKSRTPSRSGSGLGLSIVKKIIELHRGRIEVDSRAGEGTSMKVWLPR